MMIIIMQGAALAMDGIKVSVLCTAYNHEKYIRDALEGFVAQRTDFPFEVLVNDDCSADGTAEIIREYAARYPDLIRPFYQEKNLYSQGGMASLFAAVFYPNVRGEYIALCEGDDYWTDAEKLQRQADFLDAHGDYSAVVHNTLLHYCAGSSPDTPLRPLGEGDRDVDFYTVVRGAAEAFHTSSILARREYIVDPPDFHYTAAAHGFTDYAIGLWLSLNGKIRFLDSVMSVYRIASNPAAWSSKLGGQYSKLKEFIVGELAMLDTLLPHLDEAQRRAAERVKLERQYELYYIEGKVDELVKPPYDEIYRQKPFKYHLAVTLKRLFPALHSLYRRRRGYEDY